MTSAVTAVSALSLVAACGSSSASSQGAPSGAPPSSMPAPTSAASVAASPSADASPLVSGSDPITTVANLPHEHFLGVHLNYSYTPPLGGDHSPTPLTCAVYTTPVPNENAVHSLEHGAVWLTYQQGVDPAPLAQLAQLDPSYVLVSPYPTQPAKVMATAWGIQLRAGSPTDPELEKFVKKYAGGGQGGEPGASCSGVNVQQAEQLLAQGPPSGQATPPDPADKPSS